MNDNTPETNAERDVKLTRSQGRLATLHEAHKALVNPGERGIVINVQPDSFDKQTRIEIAEDAHASLNAARKAALAGRLFVVDYATLLDNNLPNVLTEQSVEPPFKVTPIFIPGFAESYCPLFIVAIGATGEVGRWTAFPSKNDDGFFWSAPGFPPGSELFVSGCMLAALMVINRRKLKPIGPPRWPVR